MAGEPRPGEPGEARPLFDQVLEVALYVPLGAALRLAEVLPSLAARGRDLAGSQVESARAVGRLVLQRARSGTSGPPVRSPVRSPAPAGPSSAEPAPSRPTAGGSPEAGRGPGGSDVGLAIPGYDALAASQVVPLLAGLSPGELGAIRRHEEANRRRRTVLGRIEQIVKERAHGEP